MSNLILPIYFRLTIGLGSFSLTKKNAVANHNKIIVSLTTFPARIEIVWLTIETMLRQQEKPDRIILWLYKGEFKGRHSLPKSLLRQEKRGLEIRFCDENLMPHKKYFYAMQEFPEALIITIDDDMFYPLDLIKKLLFYNKLFPKSIICPITRKIAVENEEILTYTKWALVKGNSKPSFLNTGIGAGAILYPPNSLHPNIFNLKKLKELALTTDDLWLKIMSLKQGTKVVSIAGEYPRYFLSIRIKNNIKLMDSNIHEGKNDVIFRNLLNQYNVQHLLTSNKNQ